MSRKPDTIPFWANNDSALKSALVSSRESRGWDTTDGTPATEAEKPTIFETNQWMNIVGRYVEWYTQRFVNIVRVAAADAPEKLRDLADIVCTGTDDHLAIADAIDIASGRGVNIIGLSKGTYKFGGSLIIDRSGNNGVAILGSPNGTTFIESTVDDSVTPSLSFPAIEFANASGNNLVSGLVFRPNPDVAEANFRGIIRDDGGTGNTVDNIRVMPGTIRSREVLTEYYGIATSPTNTTNNFNVRGFVTEDKFMVAFPGTITFDPNRLYVVRLYSGVNVAKFDITILGQWIELGATGTTALQKTADTYICKSDLTGFAANGVEVYTNWFDLTYYPDGMELETSIFSYDERRYRGRYNGLTFEVIWEALVSNNNQNFTSDLFEYLPGDIFNNGTQIRTVRTGGLAGDYYPMATLFMLESDAQGGERPTFEYVSNNAYMLYAKALDLGGGVEGGTIVGYSNTWQDIRRTWVYMDRPAVFSMA